MYTYDNWKLTDPNDTPENDRRERLYELIEEDHPDWDSDDIWIEVEARIKKENDDAAEARWEARQLSREFDREGY